LWAHRERDRGFGAPGGTAVAGDAGHCFCEAVAHRGQRRRSRMCWSSTPRFSNFRRLTQQPVVRAADGLEGMVHGYMCICIVRDAARVVEIKKWATSIGCETHHGAVNRQVEGERFALSVTFVAVASARSDCERRRPFPRSKEQGTGCGLGARRCYGDCKEFCGTGFQPVKKHGQDGRATLLDTEFRTAPVAGPG
jgi:hypothetical protein